MLKSNHGEDTFFDSLDSFRSCNSVLFPEEEEEEVSSLSSSSSSCEVVELGYQIWNSEPGCVLERRERFLREMGFSELVNSNDNLALERIAQGSGVVTSSSSCPFSNRGGGEASCSGRDLDEENKFLASKMRQCRSSRRITIYEPDNKFQQHLPNGQLLVSREATANGDMKQVQEHTTNKKRLKSWWNRFVQKTMKEGMMMRKPGGPTKDRKAPMANRMKVGYNRKRCMEFSAVYMGQQIQAHKGFIWTMKFSPDGQYLASGGEDGVVRIWRVSSTDASCKYFTAKDTSTLVDKSKGRKLIPGRKISKPASVIIPQKVFMIDESPLHEFYGHTDDVLDLCWSKSNCLLSSSKDETVRLWQVGSQECLQVFHHNNYVTCIQFNPVDDRYFISGSIDGKVRVWGISESRVVNWADVRDIITAICYQPDGQGFIVGSNSGHCRFYDASGNHLQLDAQICVQGRKKSSLNRITGFQFSPEAAQKVMITSADSKVRIFDGLDVIHKYRGLRKSGSQMSASFTSNGRHIISVGEDSRVYVWNYDGLCAASSKQAKSIRSCEHFFFEGVSVAVPWLGMEQEQVKPNLQNSSYTLDRSVTSSLPRDSARFSLSSWFSMNGRLRGLATWPEEKLPLWSVPVELDDHQHNHQQDQEHHYHQDRQQKQQFHKRPTALSSTWGLVIVTGGCDGMIRTFHNYGLPVRL